MSEGHRPSTSERVYKVLLLMYPRNFRESYGPHMAQAVGGLRREELARAGTGGLVVLWARALVDLLSSVFAERSRTAMPILSSPGLMRLGGISAMVGGALAALLGLWRVYSWSRMPYSSFSMMYVEDALGLLGTFGSLLILAGMLGLYVSIPRGSRRLATVGLLLACLATMTLSVANIYEFLVIVSSGYPVDAIVSMGVVGVGGPVRLVGFLLLGIALLLARALGRWSVLPLIVGLLPLAVVPLGLLASLGQAQGSVSEPGISSDILFVLPNVLAALGWILLGYLLLYKVREARPFDENSVSPGPTPRHGPA